MVIRLRDGWCTVGSAATLLECRVSIVAPSIRWLAVSREVYRDKLVVYVVGPCVKLSSAR